VGLGFRTLHPHWLPFEAGGLAAAAVEAAGAVDGIPGPGRFGRRPEPGANGTGRRARARRRRRALSSMSAAMSSSENGMDESSSSRNEWLAAVLLSTISCFMRPSTCAPAAAPFARGRCMARRLLSSHSRVCTGCVLRLSQLGAACHRAARAVTLRPCACPDSHSMQPLCAMVRDRRHRRALATSRTCTQPALPALWPGQHTSSRQLTRLQLAVWAARMTTSWCIAAGSLGGRVRWRGRPAAPSRAGGGARLVQDDLGAVAVVRGWVR